MLCNLVDHKHNHWFLMLTKMTGRLRSMAGRLPPSRSSTVSGSKRIKTHTFRVQIKFNCQTICMGNPLGMPNTICSQQQAYPCAKPFVYFKVPIRRNGKKMFNTMQIPSVDWLTCAVAHVKTLGITRILVHFGYWFFVLSMQFSPFQFSPFERGGADMVPLFGL